MSGLRANVTLAPLPYFAGPLQFYPRVWRMAPAFLDFVRDVVGKSRIAGAAVVCRTAIAIRSPTRFELCPLWTWPRVHSSRRKRRAFADRLDERTPK